MNRTVAFIGILAIVVFGIVGVVVLVALDRDVSPLINFLGSVVPICIAAVVTFFGLQRVSEKQDKIARVVNGNTTRMLGAITGDTRLTQEQIEQISADNQALLGKTQNG